MKDLTSFINENENIKKYKYVATVKVEGEVTAESEGDAGALADKEVEKIDGFVSAVIDNIEAVASEIKESILNDDEVETVDEAMKAFAEYFTKCDSHMSKGQMSELKDRIASYIAEHQ